MTQTRDKVISILRQKGPSLPATIAKETGTNILFASATLAELVSNKMVKITNLKIGGSPLYYLAGQEDKLVPYKNKLKEKDQRTFDLLKERRILRDTELEPLTRVSLRNIKDFAVPLEVTLNQKTEIFWKWFLLKSEEAEKLIRQILEPSAAPQKPVQTTLEPEQNESTESKEPENTEEIHQDVEPAQNKEANNQDLQTLVEEKPLQNQSNNDDSDKFLQKIQDYFDKTGIELLGTNIIKKETDVECEINLPTAVGKIRFYCRARNKKKPNDSDLASAYVQGELRRLPVLFVTTGELTKKADSMLEQEFKRIKVVRI